MKQYFDLKNRYKTEEEKKNLRKLKKLNEYESDSDDQIHDELDEEQLLIECGEYLVKWQTKKTPTEKEIIKARFSKALHLLENSIFVIEALKKKIPALKSDTHTS